MKIVRCLSLFLASLAIGQQQAHSAPTQWSGNGHWYEAVHVPAGITWTSAKTAAEARGGYLASIQSAGENAFVFGLTSSFARTRNDIGPWLGGYREPAATAVGEGWKWTSGEAFSYSNWNSSEPSALSEPYLSYHNNGDTWNDLLENGDTGYPVLTYVVEFDHQPLQITTGTVRSSDDPVRDFSITQENPNGVWSYGAMPTDFSSLTLHTATSMNGYGPQWTSGSELGNASIWLNQSTSTYAGAAPSQLSLHPGSGNQPSTLRWTSPEDGRVRLNGRFFAGDSGSMQVGVRIDQQASWTATDQGTFALNQPIKAGGTVDFVVYGGYNSGTTPLEATVKLDTLVSPRRSGTVVVGDELRFTGEPTASTHAWDFGDGQTASDANPGLRSYSAPGSYKISETTESDAFTRSVQVVAKPGNLPDFVVESVVSPATARTGAALTVSYTARNSGTAAVDGISWRDVLYLSDDAQLDSRDTPLAANRVSGHFAANGTYQGQFAIRVPSVKTAAKFLIVAVNDGWSGVEIHRLNNESASALNVQPFQVAGGAKTMAAGYYHSLAIKTDGSVVGWGRIDDWYGMDEIPLTPPEPNSDFTSLGVGYSHSLGLKADGSVVCWGANWDGELNIPSPNSDFVSIAAGLFHSLAIKNDGSIVAWGANWDSQLNGIPAPNADFVAVAAGYSHSMGLKSNGSIVTWGSTWGGDLSVPTPNSDFVAIASGVSHCLGLKSDGSIVGWGENSYGQSNVPAPNSDFVAIAAGGSHNMGLKSNGSVVCWGYNGNGQLNIPAPNSDFVAVAAGGNHSMGLKSDGTIVCWGYNGSGQCTVPSPNADFALPQQGDPELEVTPTSVSFAKVTTGTTADLEVTVKNKAGGTLSGAVTTSAPFSVVADGTYQLAAGASQTVKVRFAPTEEKVSTGTLEFTGSQSATIPVSGIGILPVPEFTQQPGSLALEWGVTAVFEAAATHGTSYRWKKDGQWLADDSRISGSQTAKLTITRIAGADGGNYHCVATSSGGSTDSQAAALAITADVTRPQVDSVVVDPGGLTISFTDNGPMSATATTQPAFYQLIRSGGDGVIGDAHDVALSLDAASLSLDAANNRLSIRVPLMDDLYRLVISANVADAAGNTLAAASTQDLMLNAYGISLGLALTPATDTGISASDAVTRSSQPEETVTWSEPGKLELDWDGDGSFEISRIESQAGQLSHLETATLADDSYTRNVRFTGVSGEQVTRSLTVRIDTTAPTLTVADAEVAARILKVSFAETPAQGVGVGTFVLSSPTGAAIPCLSYTDGYLVTEPLVGIGDHTLRADGLSDTAGNGFLPANFSVRDTQAPQVRRMRLEKDSQGRVVAIRFVFNEAIAADSLEQSVAWLDALDQALPISRVELSPDGLTLRVETQPITAEGAYRVKLNLHDLAGHAIPDGHLVFADDFEDDVDARFSTTATDSSTISSRILGRFDNAAQTLQLNGLPPHNRARVLCDFFAIDSWDGDESFSVLVDGETLLTRNPNNVGGQANPDSIGWMAHMGWWSYFPEQFFQDLSAEKSVSDPALKIDFRGAGLQGVSDESWGIDNVRVFLDGTGTDGFCASFTVDLTAPTVIAMSLADATVNGAVSSLDLTFSEPMRSSTFNAQSIILRRPDSVQVVPQAVVQTGATTWQVRFASQTAPGVWSVNVQGATDLAGTACSYAGQFTQLQPDLTVGSLQFPEQATGGTAIDVTWQLANADGQWTGEYQGKMVERLYLVGKTSGTQRLLAALPFEGTLSKAGNVARSVRVTLPVQGAEGEHFLKLETALASSVPEVSGNNTVVSADVLTIVEPSLPDLAVKDLVVPEQAVPGTSINVSWTVENSGSAAASGTWWERVYLSTDRTPSQDDILLLSQRPSDGLAVGGSATRNARIDLPMTLASQPTMYFLVRVDPDDEVVERLNGVANDAAAAQGTQIPAVLGLTCDQPRVAENVANQQLQCTVSRSGNFSQPLTLRVQSSRPGDIAVPASVTIPSGKHSAVISLSVIDNAVVDGERTAAVSVSSAGYRGAELTLAVLDNDVPTLAITLSEQRTNEGSSLAATVRRDFVTNEALTVFLESSATSQCTVPNSVVIPANAAAAGFVIQVKNDTIAEIDQAVTIRAKASGHITATSSLVVVDDDLPSVSLVVSPQMVSEGAGLQAAMGVLTRAGNLNGDILVRFQADSSAVILPGEVVLRSGVVSTQFAIGTVDNSQVDGDRLVTLTGSIVLASCGCTANPTAGESLEQPLMVLDNDGPTLSVSANPATMREGLAEAGSLVISHNTTLTAPLVVKLQHNQPNEISIPTEVTIPAGAASITVPVTTLDDGTEDGAKLVTLSASADEYTPGTGWLMVSDQNHPDYVVTDVQTPAGLVSGDTFEVHFAVGNVGFRTGAAGVPVKIYCTQGSGVAAEALVAETTTQIAIPTGGSSKAIVRCTAPSQPGNFRVAVVVNPDGQFTELNTANNTTWSAVFPLNPSYLATAQTDFTSGVSPSTVPITGTALQPNGTTPAAGMDVEIYVISNGIRRTLSAKSNAQGAFAASFAPIQGEAGHYVMGACFPGTNGTAAQDAFDILGIQRVDNSNIIWDMTVGDSRSGTIVLRNRSQAALSGLQLSAVGTPTTCRLETTIPARVEGDGLVAISYQIQATDITQGDNYEAFSLQLTSQEGVKLAVPCYFFSQSQKALLKANPASLTTTMVPGVPRLVQCSITNDGAGASGPIQVALPNVSWMRVVEGANIANLNKGESFTLTLELNADATTPLNAPMSGTIAVSATNAAAALTVPFRFTAVSENQGTILIDVVDEYTYYVESAPHVANASVTVRNPYTGEIVAQGQTTANGTWQTPPLAVGKYRVDVNADKHAGWAEYLEVAPGSVTRKEVFLQYQAITYKWEVERTEVEDKYNIELVTHFETNVPKPVVSIDCPSKLPDVQVGETYLFEAIITNKGLIAAEDVELQIPEHSLYEFKSMINQIAHLPANSSVRVAVTMSRKAPVATQRIRAMAANDDPEKDPCLVRLGAIYYYYCAGSGNNGRWQEWTHTITYLNHCYGQNLNELLLELGNLPWARINSGTPSDPTPVRPGGSTNIPIPTDPKPPIPIEDLSTQCEPCSKLIGNAMIGCLNSYNPGVVTAGFVDIGMLIAGYFDSIESKKLEYIGRWVSEYIGGKIPGVSPYLCVGNILEALGKCTRVTNEPMRASFKAMATSDGTFEMDAIEQQMGIVHSLLGVSNDLTTLFLGDAKWLKEEKLSEFMGIFADCSNQGSTAIAESDQPILLAFSGSVVTPADIEKFIARWNRSVAYWAAGVTRIADVPAGQSTDFISMDGMDHGVNTIQSLEDSAKAKGYDSVAAMSESTFNYLNDYLERTKNSVCAKVGLSLSQTATLTREAFDGTLTVFNGHSSVSMKQVKLDLKVTDSAGNLCNDRFDISTTELKSLSEIDGTGELLANTEGKAKVRFIPEHSAAPETSQSYQFGGTLSYLDPFTNQTVSVELFPVTLEVNPSPLLDLHYFLQRDVFGDDPFTDAIEPMVPAEFALLVHNRGYGTAKQFRIDSAQPKIFENQKGLQVDFRMSDFTPVGTAINGSSSNQGLSQVNLGDITGQSTGIAQWWLTSSLLGHFRDMDAKFTHTSGNGNAELSLINSTKIHKLIRSVVGDADGKPDFLVTENDVQGLPDKLFFSDGQVEDVRVLPGVCADAPSGATPEIDVQVEAPTTAGWHYISLPDPGAGRYQVTGLVRASDGAVLPARNVWLTDRRLPDGGEPVYENTLHVLVELGSAAETFRVQLKALDENPPSVMRFDGVVSPTLTPLDALTVEFSEEIDPASFGSEDLELKVQGVTIADLSSLTITPVSATTFWISGISGLNTNDGLHLLTVQAAGVTDRFGNSGCMGKQVAWVVASESPEVTEITGVAPNARLTSPVDALVVRFTRSLMAGSFDVADLQINGQTAANLIIKPLDADRKLYEISGLAAQMTTDGEYRLRLDCRGLQSAAGLAGKSESSLVWSLDRQGPKITAMVRDVPAAALGNQMEVQITFNEAISESLPVSAGTLRRNGEVVAGITPSIRRESAQSLKILGLELASTEPGSYEFTFDASAVRDAAGLPGTGTQAVSWVVDTEAPAAIADLAISPDTGSSASDGITAQASFDLVGTLPEPGLTVKVLRESDSGTQEIGAIESDGAFRFPMALAQGGRQTLLVRCTDAAGNSSDTRMVVFLDVTDFGASLSGAPTSTTEVAQQFVISLSEPITGDVLPLAALSLLKDGSPVDLSGLVITSESETTFRVSGLQALCSEPASYQLTLDLTKLSEKLSGRAGVGNKSISWSLAIPDTTDPELMEFTANGSPAAQTTDRLSSVSLGFSESVNIPDLLASGMIEQAVRLVKTDTNGIGIRSLPLDPTGFQWDEATLRLTWSGEIQLEPGSFQLYVDLALITDAAGNHLAASAASHAAIGISTLTQRMAVLQVAAYAAPTLVDWNSDGLMDLLVGEKSADDKGRVKVFLNHGSAAIPSFGAGVAIMADGQEIALPAEGCLGLAPRVADVTGDGHADLLLGRADGSIWLCENHPDAANPWKFAAPQGLWQGASDSPLSSRALFEVVNLQGDATPEIVLGGMDGKLRLLSKNPLSGTWAPIPITAAAQQVFSATGRSAPAFGDLTGDGSPDLLVGDTEGALHGFLTNPTSPLDFLPVGTMLNANSLGSRSRPAIGNLDGDALPDVLVGTDSGLVYWLESTPPSNPSIALTMPAPIDQPPVVDEIPAALWLKGTPHQLDVCAHDEDGQAIELSADLASLPGAMFADGGNGTATLAWTPGADVTAGTHQAVITATANGKSTTRNAVIRIESADPYWSWMAAKAPTLPAGSSPDLWSPDSDPDADGCSNAFEMAFLRNPLRADTTPVKFAKSGTLGTSWVIYDLSILRHRDAGTYVDLWPTRSSDIKTWAKPAAGSWQVAVDPNGDTDQNPETREVRWRFYIPATSTESFFRIEGSRKP